MSTNGTQRAEAGENPPLSGGPVKTDGGLPGRPPPLPAFGKPRPRGGSRGRAALRPAPAACLPGPGRAPLGPRPGGDGAAAGLGRRGGGAVAAGAGRPVPGAAAGAEPPHRRRVPAGEAGAFPGSRRRHGAVPPLPARPGRPAARRDALQVRPRPRHRLRELRRPHGPCPAAGPARGQDEDRRPPPPPPPRRALQPRGRAGRAASRRRGRPGPREINGPWRHPRSSGGGSRTRLSRALAPKG